MGSTGDRQPLAWHARWTALRAHWAGLAPRERLGMTVAAAGVGGLLLWRVAMAPAWHTLQDAPARIDHQGSQLQALQQLAAEATELRTTPPVTSAQADAALTSASTRYGGRVSLQRQGDRATVTVRDLTGDELRDWLAEARSNARARATEVQLTRGAQGYTGTLVLSLGDNR